MSTKFCSSPEHSRGRLFFEKESGFRNCFQRDRDRIIHSSAFKRLKHKTQVFVADEGDYYRTRLMHSIEVSQVARTIAEYLGLNEALTEAIALAHDLGHPPFGHSGEETLNDLMEPYGGFDHNAQAIRIVTSLEKHYARFNGLNLTWESLEGIAKHNGPFGEKLPFALKEYSQLHDLELSTYAGPEAQVASIADDIAYNNHDLLDGLRAKLFTVEEVTKLPILSDCFIHIDKSHTGLENHRRTHEAMRMFFRILVEDVIVESKRKLKEIDPKSVKEVRLAGQQVILFSKDIWNELEIIKDFLFYKMYRADSVLEARTKGDHIIQQLFKLYMDRPDQLPAEWQYDVRSADNHINLARIVADYISGMTDLFACGEHKKNWGKNNII